MTVSSQQTAAFGLPWGLLLLSSPDVTPPVPVLEIVKVYGTLAGSDCYGSQAPSGSSCQLPLAALEKSLRLSKPLDTDTPGSFRESITQDEFDSSLQNLNFQWPLKPYGLNNEASLKKTTVMNKGAETRVYMDELESRGLYDRRNPTGPLPTSLRPKLNRALQAEGIDPGVSRLAFESFGGSKGVLTKHSLEAVFGDTDMIDYYGFLELIGKDQISWPN
jgi:hypothetical protein